jgi:hypothetical protein
MAGEMCTKCRKQMVLVKRWFQCSGCRAYFCPSCMDRYCMYCRAEVKQVKNQ